MNARPLQRPAAPCLRRALTCFGTVLLVSGMVIAQIANPASPRESPSNPAVETIVGCLNGGPTEFQLTDAEGYAYNLQGRIWDLQKYAGEEISVRGTPHGPKDTSPAFTVASVQQVFKAPEPKLSASVTSASNWHVQKNTKYGVQFALPSFPGEGAPGDGSDSTNFVAEHGAVTLSSVTIPREIYPDTNFVGGSFLFSVNPEITNRESCEKFGHSDARFLSSRTLGGIRYEELTEGDAAAGTYYDDYYFHALQNGMCYEIAFQLGGYNTANQNLGCRVPIVGEERELDVIKAFASRVSYFPPATGVLVPESRESVPRVTSFTASSGTADNARNRGTIKFSWSTENADYVEFSYRCSVVGLGVVILEGGGRNCENDPAPITPETQQFNRSPNSSTEVTFGNSRHDEPISVVVTITPFSHGKAYSSARKSISISVDPYNPFPEGVPTSTANMTLTYSDAANDSYQQGASLTINWTDTSDRDPCVNLYLVQDDKDGRNFISQIMHQCLRPAATGSYIWTIPTKYAGSGFRIYARTPGSSSSAIGAPFRIVRSDPPTPPTSK